VWTPDDGAVAAGHSVDPAGWRELFDELMCLVGGRFGRVEPRRTAREFVLGLLSPVERKNCWWLAEQAGHADPQAMQRLLRTAVWDADAVRDDLRAFVAAQLGHPAGVLIPDETGFLKKGTCSVGVQGFGANRADGVRPGRPVEIAAAQRAALDPGKLRASASGPTNRDRCSRRAGIIDEGMPTIRRLLWTSAGRAPVPPWTVPRRPRARERCLRPGKGRRGSKGLSSRSWEPGPT